MSTSHRDSHVFREIPAISLPVESSPISVLLIEVECEVNQRNNDGYVFLLRDYCSGGQVVWFNPNCQLSTMQPLVHSPLVG